MAGLEIVENPRGSGGEDSGSEPGRDSVKGKTVKRKRSRKRRNSGGSEGAVQGSPAGQDPEEKRKENGMRQNDGQQADSQTHDLLPTKEDHRARFYEHYRKEAEEYDREFTKKYDEDLNTTLIFAGLFSAVTSAFIIEVHSHLQQDPNDETAALLRVLLYKIDNTTFGNDVPTLPQWTGPPRTIVHVQAILFASLAASLFSAFLAMLGKQWLNRYASIDKRGTAIERSQNRQRKLDGIVTWYFDHVMESLPVMLQIALLLLGSAISRYLWEINITVASVVLTVTSFGLIVYIFIVITGAASESCPYQTPGSHALRHLRPKVQSILRSAASAIVSATTAIPPSLRNSFRRSTTFKTIATNVRYYRPRRSWGNTIAFSVNTIFWIPCILIADAYRLGGAMVRALFAFPAAAYRLGSVTVRSSVSLARRVYNRLRGASSTPQQRSDQQTVMLDLRCISWMVQTFLDKAVHLSALKHLATMMALTDFDPTLAADCFDAFIGCINISGPGRRAAITQDLEQLATASVMGCLRTISHLLVVDPTSRIFEDVCQRYTRFFPFMTDFNGLPFSHILHIIHNIFYATRGEHADPVYHRARPQVQWEDYKPSSNELTVVARALTEIAWFERQRGRREQVPRWILRFALCSLSQHPLPPTSVVVDCLSIVAIDLGHNPLNTAALGESVREEQVLDMINQTLGAMAARVPNQPPWRWKLKTLSVLLPYAVLLERNGKPRMLDALLCAARASGGLMWFRAEPVIHTLFNEASPETIVHVSPHINWQFLEDSENLIPQWAAATSAISAIPYTEEVGQITEVGQVVDTLLHIAAIDSLRPHIPVGIWAWLEKRPFLPTECVGRRLGTRGHLVHYIRALGNIEILKSYFFLVWSEWDEIWDGRGLTEMQVSIRQDFSGLGMECHRKYLVRRLDQVLEGLNRGGEYLEQNNPRVGEGHIQRAKENYTTLKEVLLEVDRGATKILTLSHSMFACALPLPCP